MRLNDQHEEGRRMAIVFACIAPHAAETIPELAGDSFEAFAETHASMKDLANLMNEQKPETIVIATPHNLRLEATIGVVTSEHTEGLLTVEDKQVKLRCKCDLQLAKKILEKARESALPVVGANFGTSEGPSSCMPMDWGTLIPLWFFTRDHDETAKVVLVTPSREISLKKLVDFGSMIVGAAESLGRKVAFVASADQGHAHDPKGPYGFNVASRKFDDAVKEAISSNDLGPLLDLPSQFIEDAKPDSVWQIAILEGILESVSMKGRLMSYQVPTYFGILCASYLPVQT
jgi:aromatic ring-opening dioxygenase LigB subunit